MRDLIACDVLTGFLGSGKTTLLNAFLRSPAAKGAAVIVNEVGAVGIDQLVLSQVAENLKLLESGCLCCTLSGSLRDTVLVLLEDAQRAGLPVSRLIVETTGLAEPQPILHSLLGDKGLTQAVRLDRVITTVDAEHVRDHVVRHPEVARQIAAADVLVLSKTDLVAPADAEQIEAWLDTVNPLAAHERSVAGAAAEVVFATQTLSQPQAGQLRALHEAGRGVPGTKGVVHAALAHAEGSGADDADDDPAASVGYLGHAAPLHTRLRTESFFLDTPVTWAGLAAWWHLVSQHYGDDLLRCKGLIRLSGTAEPVAIIQAVGRHFHPPTFLPAWPDADPRSRVVCIGVGLAREWLDASLRALQINEPGLLPSTMAELDTLFPNFPEDR